MAKQPQKPKSLQDIFRERQMKDLKREYYFQRINQFWTATKRLALVGLLGYGTFWGSKPENRQTLKSFLKSRSAPIEQRIGNFKEGVNMIKDGLRQDKNAQAYHEEQQRRIKEYRDMGIRLLNMPNQGQKNIVKNWNFIANPVFFVVDEIK